MHQHNGCRCSSGLRPKYRRRLVKAVYAFHSKGQEKGGRFYRYGDVALLTILLGVLTTTIVGQYQLVSHQHLIVFAITFLILISVSVSILAIGFLRAMGKWGLLLIAIISVVAVLRVLIWALSQT